MMDRQRYSEAEVAYRKTLELKPGLKEVYYRLGAALMLQAQFDEAAAALQKASDLLSAKDPLLVQARQLQQQCRRYMILDTKLPVVLRGTEKPAKAAEQIEFAELCRIKKLYAAAAHFYGDAFTAEPKLADDVRGGARYNAACAAALAGCGQGKDADKLEDKERARLRRRALDWLREDLTWWGTVQADGKATNVSVSERLRHSQTDGDLAGLRAKVSLARLPDEERQQWERFWSDVDALLLRVSEPK
jgi:serine/threonine-protein kinase